MVYVILYLHLAVVFCFGRLMMDHRRIQLFETGGDSIQDLAMGGAKISSEGSYERRELRAKRVTSETSYERNELRAKRVSSEGSTNQLGVRGFFLNLEPLRVNLSVI